ncbi:MAG: carboxy terminal-processing peptidase [Candidatus Aminicenantes bacterium]|nr:MAG: carboxy terminal-processing peptidase [Candidatus Aminicenantes bacterium]
MKQKIIVLLSLIAAIALVIEVVSLPGGGYAYAEKEVEIPKERLISQIIHTGLERWHYSGKKIDDDFSQKAFPEFLEFLDASKRFLLQSDIETLRKYGDKIDDQLESGSTEMMKLATGLLEQRIRQVMGFYEELLAKPFDFTKDEYLELDPDKLDYCLNLEELKEYWRKTLKYRALLRYITLLEVNETGTASKADSQGETGDKTKSQVKKARKKSDKELEAEARQSVLKSFRNIFNRLLQANKNDSLSRYLNSLVQVYDPHTTYFLPVDKETFDMQMSGSFEGIGALLQNEDEYVKVASIVPGGPSWRGKQLEAGDLILKVGQGDEEPVDIIGMRTVDAVKLIRGKKGTLVRLTVKKPDGRIVVIPIVRDVVILEDTFARSAILLHKESNRRFGYIELPGFYDDFNHDGGRNSADDVKKEIEKLKKKKVDGIILDLRSNTGGALRDAVRMSGLFIPQGPIVQVKNKQAKIRALKDQDPNVNYKGHLVVLVNRLSASASEILAAALQDYNRAVIVGGHHSYGKGTVQAMINLDNIISSNYRSGRERYDSFGALTITIQKFYRINGMAIQLRGVTPDIVLPDTNDVLEIGEKHLDYSLKWDVIPPAAYEKWNPRRLVSKELLERSSDRVQKNTGFQQLKKYIETVKQMRKMTWQSLLLTEMMKQQEEIKMERKKLEKSQKELLNIMIVPSAELVKKKSDRLDKIAKEQQTEWFKELNRCFLLISSLPADPGRYAHSV